MAATSSAAYQEFAPKASAYINSWFSQYEQRIRSAANTFSEKDIQYIELLWGSQDRISCIQGLSQIDGYNNLSKMDQNSLSRAAKATLDAKFSAMKNSLPKSSSEVPSPNPEPAPTPEPEQKPAPPPEESGNANKLPSALDAINKAVREDAETYVKNKKNSGEIINRQELSFFIDKSIESAVKFYAPLSSSDEDKEWLDGQAKVGKEDLINELFEKYSPDTPSTGGENDGKKPTNRNDNPSSTSSPGASTTSSPSSSAKTSVIFDSMHGELGKRNAFTVHNINGRRYYSTIDATIFLNGKIIEEVVQLQWTVEENVMPLFGYNSYVWDEIARGSRIVSGAFAINFTVPDYLEQLVNNTSDDSSIAFKNTGKMLTKDEHSARWAKGFTIGIGYGSKDSIIGEQPCKFLEDVQLKSSGQALDTQGGQLVEIYQFIAKDWHDQR
jgi:hypothetical protein